MLCFKKDRNVVVANQVNYLTDVTLLKMDAEDIQGVKA